MSSIWLSNRSAHRCDPVAASKQLDGNANTVAGLADAALEHIANAELAPDLLDIDRLALVGESGMSRDDEERESGPRQCGDDVLDHAVGEVVLLRIGAQILRKGRTAIEVLLGSASAGLCGSPALSEGAAAAGPCASSTGPTNRKPLRGRVLMSRCSSPESPMAPAGRIQARRQCRIGHHAPAPDGADEIVLGDDTLPVADQVIQQVEHLRCDSNHIRSAMQFATVGVECVLLEEIAQAADPSGHFRSAKNKPPVWKM